MILFLSLSSASCAGLRWFTPLGWVGAPVFNRRLCQRSRLEIGAPLRKVERVVPNALFATPSEEASSEKPLHLEDSSHFQTKLPQSCIFIRLVQI